MKKLGLLIVFILFITITLNLKVKAQSVSDDSWWEVQSVDTMKYSRDLASEKLGDPTFDETIDFQVKNIRALGATHVAIGTPYDSEFLPYLRRWVDAARKYELSVWFRGNFSGWEGWFGRKPIGKNQHAQMLENFILDNPELFEDGDIFTSCPECENGALGDPRHTGKVSEFKDFLINEYNIAKSAFNDIGKNVAANYFSMNGDVANLIMDRATTSALDGVLVVDHYVADPSQLVEDVERYREQSGGRVMLGEVGVPIPDIHGKLTEAKQARWMEEMLSRLAKTDGVIGINYWVFSGGTTELWSGNKKREVANVIEKYYKPKKLTIKVSDEIGRIVNGATIKIGPKEYTVENGNLTQIQISPGIESATIVADGYKSYSLDLNNLTEPEEIVLSSERDNILFRIIKFIRNLLS